MKIIFDCFGTLIDTGTGSVESCAEILKNVGLNEDAAAFYGKWKRIKKEMMLGEIFHTEKELFVLSLQKLFDEYGVNADAKSESEPMIRTLFSRRSVFPDTKKALEMLDLSGVEYAIGSTTDTDSIMYYLSQNGLIIDKIFTSEDMRVYKPKPLFYTTILEKTGWSADECVFVGDNLTDDVIGPKSVGMKAVLIDRSGTFDPLCGVSPDMVIDSLTKLGFAGFKKQNCKNFASFLDFSYQ